MSKVGKRYKRTDELKSTTRTDLPDDSRIAVYKVEEKEEFSIDADEFMFEDNVSEGFIPKKQGEVYVNSAMQETETDVVFSKSAIIPSGTLSLGGILDERFTGDLVRGVTRLKDSGESFLADDAITGLIHTVPLTLINDDLNASVGVGRTRVRDGIPFVWSSFGGTDTDEVTVSGNRRIIVEFREVLTAYITAQRFRGTQGKMHYRVIDITARDGVDTLVYTSEQGDPIDFDTAVGPDFQIEYDTLNPNFLIQDNLLRLEFFSADGQPMTLKGQLDGVVPPSGDITNFAPFFETKFSTTRDRTIFPNDEAIKLNSDTEIDEAGTVAVDTTSNTVKVTVDPDNVKIFEVYDSKNNFTTNNCTVELLIFNTRNFPNDNIGTTEGDIILASNVDAGASGTKNMLSDSGTPIIYNNGTNWFVVTDQETLSFTSVTNRSGLFSFRFLGDKAALTVGDQTQLVENVTGEMVTFDTIGAASNPIDEIFHLEVFNDRSRSFDDTTVGMTDVLDENNDYIKYCYDDTNNAWISFDVRFNLVREAPQDGNLYSRKNGTWVQDNAADTTFDSSNLCTDSDNVQDAIDDTTRFDMVLVKELADLPTPVSNVITLDNNKSYQFEGNVNIGANRIVCGSDNLIYGLNRLVDTITSTTTGDLITSASGDLNIHDLRFNCASGNFLNFDGNSQAYSLLLGDITIVDCDAFGTLTDTDVIQMSSVNTDSTTTDGITFTGAHHELDITTSVFRGFNGTMVDLGTAVFDVVIIEGNQFDVASGQTGIDGAANSANISSGNEGSLTTNSFTGAGTYVATIDECDNRWRFRGNSGVTDTSVGASIYVAAGDEATTTISAINTPVALAGTFTESFACKFTTTAAGLLTYTGDADINVSISAKYLCAPDISINIQFSGYVQKNGSGTIANSRDFMVADSVSPVKMVIFGGVSLSTNDTLQLVVENNSGTQNAVTDAITFIVEEG